MYNAGCALGRTVSLDDCERACAVSATDGTDTKNLLKGLKSLGFKVVAEIKEGRADVALLRLLASLQEGHAAILAVDSDTHWVAAVGRLGSRVFVADSAESELVLSYTAEHLALRWKHNQSRTKFYGVVMS